MGVNVLDENVVKKIYEVKGRFSDNLLIVYIYEKEEVYDLVKDISDKVKFVIEKFWLGFIIIILNKKDIILYKISGGFDIVVIRMFFNVIVRVIIKEVGIFIVVFFVNILGCLFLIKVKYVYEEMNGRVDGIVLGGDSNFGLELIVLDLIEEIFMILRLGSIIKEVLEEFFGEVKFDLLLSKKEDN